MVDSGAMDTGAAVPPVESTPPLRRRRRHQPPPPGRRGRPEPTEHATIDLTGARNAIIDTGPPEYHHAAAVYSTGEGPVDAYHYDRQPTHTEQLASSPDMQAITPEVRGPGQ